MSTMIPLASKRKVVQLLNEAIGFLLYLQASWVKTNRLMQARK